jgi:hypothetical protein
MRRDAGRLHLGADRELAFECNSHIGKLNDAMDDAPQMGWTVVDMKSGWKEIFPAK